jgi:hypothetical protein
MLFRTEQTADSVKVFRQDGGLHRSVPLAALESQSSTSDKHEAAVKLATHARRVTRMDTAQGGWWWEVPLATHI